MSYQVWSVVFGEQPSASKWNILGTNDASFNDGTGIADNAILNRHLASGIVKASELDLDPTETYIATDQTTTSTSYTDLATAGPAVTIPVGSNGLALVIFGCGMYTAAALKAMSIAVSGASTVAASDDWMLRRDGAAFDQMTSRAKLFTGLTAGNNTFTAKYKVAAGTGNFFARWVIAIPL